MIATARVRQPGIEPARQLRVEETLEAVAAAALRLQTTLGRMPSLGDVQRCIDPSIARFDVFQECGLIAVRRVADAFEVELEDEPERTPGLTDEVAHHVADGSLAWAIEQARSVVVPAGLRPGHTFLQPIGTSARVHAVLVGILHPEIDAVPQSIREALSVVSLHCASVLEAARLHGELERHGEQLERTVAERTAELERSEAEARAANEAKSTFLARMSHEIRTPLSGIIGMGSLLAETELEPGLRGQVETINRSAASLLEVVNDILDLSRVEAGQLSLEAIVFDLRAMLDDVLALFAPVAAEKHVELYLHFGAGTPRQICADPARVRQVVTNLVGNAVKFTEHGQIVVDVRLDGRSGSVEIAIEDSGIGIDEDALEGIFAPFSQAKVSTARRFGGSGLGLSISRHLARLMDGDVEVVSEVGQGSTFTFTLRPRMVDYRPIHQADLAGKRVWLVSDRPGLVRSVSDILAGSGGALQHWSSPELVADALLAPSAPSRPDALLVDVCWREQAASWLVGEVQKAAGGPGIRMVALVPPGELALGHRLCGLGFDAWVARPVGEEALLCAVTGDDVGTGGTGSDGPISARVLVAEDDPVNSAMASMMLRQVGVEPDLVGTGREAVEAARNTHYDLILMDVQMPEMGGHEAARAIRETLGSDVPIVALTATAGAEARAAAAAAGMNEHMTKPFRMADLRDVLRRWTVGEREPLRGSGPMAVDAPAANPRAGRVALPHPVFEPAPAVARVAGNRALIGEVLRIFLDSWAEIDAELTGGVETGDVERLRRIAHRVKSTSDTVGAARLGMMARVAEATWAEGDSSNMHETVAALQSGFAELRPLAERFLAEVEVSA